MNFICELNGKPCKFTVKNCDRNCKVYIYGPVVKELKQGENENIEYRKEVK